MLFLLIQYFSIVHLRARNFINPTTCEKKNVVFLISEKQIDVGKSE